MSYHFFAFANATMKKEKFNYGTYRNRQRIHWLMGPTTINPVQYQIDDFRPELSFCKIDVFIHDYPKTQLGFGLDLLGYFDFSFQTGLFKVLSLCTRMGTCMQVQTSTDLMI